jgi:hypothetical protein
MKKVKLPKGFPTTMDEALKEIDELVREGEARGLVPSVVMVGPEINELLKNVETLVISRASDDPRAKDEPYIKLEIVVCSDIFGPALGEKN